MCNEQCALLKVLLAYSAECKKNRACQQGKYHGAFANRAYTKKWKSR